MRSLRTSFFRHTHSNVVLMPLFFFCLFYLRITETKNERNRWPNRAPSPSRLRTIRPDGGRPARTIRCCPRVRRPVTRRRRWPTSRGPPIPGGSRPPREIPCPPRRRTTIAPWPMRPLTRYLRPPSESNITIIFLKFYSQIYFYTW